MMEREARVTPAAYKLIKRCKFLIESHGIRQDLLNKDQQAFCVLFLDPAND